MSENVYESETLLGEYLHFHFGEADAFLPWEGGPKSALQFPQRCAELIFKQLDENSAIVSALDLGCAVGGASFALARRFGQVVGVDFSQRFIDAANQLKNEGSMEYSVKDEGSVMADRLARVDPEVDRKRLVFAAGDACALDTDIGSFDAVLMANLLCRLPDPAACLKRASDLVNPGGLLAITTPCTWLEEYTPVKNWLGGYTDDQGLTVRTLDGIHQHLDSTFECLKVEEMPFLIREHARKFQWTVAQASVWRRRG